MLQFRYLPFVLFLVVGLLAGCASSKEATEPAKAPHPLAGAWDYSIDTPQGIYTGVMTFAEVEDMLTGTIAAAESPDQEGPLEELMFDSEASTVSFKFDSGEYGMMIVNLTMEGEALNGQMTVNAELAILELDARQYRFDHQYIGPDEKRPRRRGSDYAFGLTRRHCQRSQKRPEL